uniref:Uncharacterized protein n=1 Tax=Timema cristinae TaxID=61476 RepID=A0A7R9CYT9_TIMCR|nr:unnamed protein product [Timema cristinae]
MASLMLTDSSQLTSDTFSQEAHLNHQPHFHPLLLPCLPDHTEIDRLSVLEMLCSTTHVAITLGNLFKESLSITYGSEQYESDRGMNDTNNNIQYTASRCDEWSEAVAYRENIHPFGFFYSPRYNKWSTMAPMQRERCRFSLNVLGGRLYAIGGASEADDVMVGEDGEVSACERYDPETDCWECVRPLPGYRTQHAGAVWGNRQLYVCGGLDRDLVLSSMRCYDIASDTWESRAPMLAPRADHIMLALGERLYVCGGWAEDAETGNRILVDTIDVYDVSTDSWKVVSRVPTPRAHAGIVGVGSKIYIIGGFRGDALFDRATAVIECYDLETDSWTTGDKYPHEIWEHTCVTLYIPRCRDDMEVLAGQGRG